MSKHNQRGPLLGAALIFLFFQFLSPMARASDAVETGGGQPRYLALTFDDGPSGKTTTQLLDGLQRRGVRATFFLCGYRMELFPDLVGRIAEDGHELAAHGYTHTYMNTMDEAAVLSELLDTSGLITELTGQHARIFRPPGGLYSEAVLSAAEQAEQAIVLWSLDPFDWRDKDAATIARRIVQQAQSGDVVLLHDLYQTSVDAALRVIDTLSAQGWEFVTISELAALTGQTLSPGQILSLR